VMKFKDDEMINDIIEGKIDARLIQVLRMVDAFSILCFDKEIMITSLYRGNDTESQHSKGRAADIRTKWYSPNDLVKLEKWLYKNEIIVCSHPEHDGAYILILAVEPHEELKGTEQQHLHVHVK
jgi:hypothetical protein